MSKEVIKDTGEYYRSYDKASDTWTRHYFWNLAKLTLLNSGETVQHAIDNVSNKVLGIIAQSDSTSTETTPSSKLFHDKMEEMNTNFQAGCGVIANAISSSKSGASQTDVTVDGVSTPVDSTPNTMANNIAALAAKCIDSGYAKGYTVGTNDTGATDSALFKAGVTWAYDNPNTDSKCYKQGYMDAIGTTVGSGKLHHLSSGQKYTVTERGIYWGDTYLRDRTASGPYFTKNSETCNFSGRNILVQHQDQSTGTVVNSWYEHTQSMLEYCEPGDVLYCSNTASWYKLY